MVEIVFLIIAIGAIVTVSRQRGGNPLLWGPLALGGYFGLKFLMIKFDLFTAPPVQVGDLNFARMAFGI